MLQVIVIGLIIAGAAFIARPRAGRPDDVEELLNSRRDRIRPAVRDA